MIEINNIEDLIPYAKFISKLKNRIETAKVRFSFIDEEGLLEDVSINIDCDIEDLLSKSEVFGELLKNDKSIFYESEIVAKNIYLNSKLNVYMVKCENLFVSGFCKTENLIVKNNIKADFLDCKSIFCERLECDNLICDDMSVVYAKIGKFETQNHVFDNVEFHGLTFSSDIDLSDWSDEKYVFWSNFN